MNEDTAVTCNFGSQPRGRQGPMAPGCFGAPMAIWMNFHGMEPADQKAAVHLMRERGHDWDEMARILGCDEEDLQAIAARHCPLIAMPGDPEAGEGRKASQLLKRPAEAAAFDRALDEALQALDALRVKAGAEQAGAFDFINEDLCAAMGFGVETARRRMQALESRRMIGRVLRPGLPQLVVLRLSGQCRLDAINRRSKP